nr:MAG TPA: hypothetical protein [Bacteriophage sp.]
MTFDKSTPLFTSHYVTINSLQIYSASKNTFLFTSHYVTINSESG